jgi:hypothetical protein
MAKSKSKTASKSKAKLKVVSNKAPTLPSGYRVIGRAPNWDIEKNPVISGERGPTVEVKFTDPPKKGEKKPKVRLVRTCVVTDEVIGPVNVWESGMLKDFFDQTEDGDNVRIEFRGYGQAKRGQNAPKLFTCGVLDAEAA